MRNKICFGWLLALARARAGTAAMTARRSVVDTSIAPGISLSLYVMLKVCLVLIYLVDESVVFRFLCEYLMSVRPSLF